MDSRRLYKVTYKINMLNQFGEFVQSDGQVKKILNLEESIMDSCVEAGELDVFESKNFQDLIEFKWQYFAKSFMLFGCAMHFLYIGTLTFFINFVYIQNN